MPKMDGMELLSKLREDDKTILIPVIFISAATDDGETPLSVWGEELIDVYVVGFFDGRLEGIVDCILKPFRVR